MDKRYTDAQVQAIERLFEDAPHHITRILRDFFPGIGLPSGWCEVWVDTTLYGISPDGEVKS
jgi:hypothetical protein